MANGVAHATNDQTQCFDAPSYTSHMCKLPPCEAAFLGMLQAGELSRWLLEFYTSFYGG